MKTILSLLVLAVVLPGAVLAEEAAKLANEKQYEALTRTDDNKHYYNQKFDLNVVKPDEWYAQSAKETMWLQMRGAKMAAGDDKNLDAALSAATKTTLPLFGFFKVPPGTPNTLNPNVIGAAEYVAAFPGIKTGCDYLENVKKVMGMTQMQITFDDKCMTESVSGSQFGYYNASMEVGGQTVKQRYWACRQNAHAIFAVQTFFSEEGDALTRDVVESMQVKCD